MTELANRALLVSLQISQWTARKFDRNETSELALKHGTPVEMARVNKSLLGNCPELAAIHKLTNELRWTYYRNSLPWGQEGINIISTESYLPFTKLMREGIDKWRAAVKTFLAVYEQRVGEMPRLLNGLYREEDYPPLWKLADKFSIDCKFFPIATDFRVELADDELASLTARAQENAQSALAAASKDAWRRVHELVEHAVERLADPEARFRDSLVENAQALCKTLTVLNIAQDPALEKIRQEIEGALCKHNPDTLRSDPAVRQDVADRMKDVMSRMGGFYQP